MKNTRHTQNRYVRTNSIFFLHPGSTSGVWSTRRVHPCVDSVNWEAYAKAREKCRKVLHRCCSLESYVVCCAHCIPWYFEVHPKNYWCTWQVHIPERLLVLVHTLEMPGKQAPIALMLHSAKDVHSKAQQPCWESNTRRRDIAAAVYTLKTTRPNARLNHMLTFFASSSLFRILDVIRAARPSRLLPCGRMGCSSSASTNDLGPSTFPFMERLPTAIGGPILERLAIEPKEGTGSGRAAAAGSLAKYVRWLGNPALSLAERSTASIMGVARRRYGALCV